MNAYTVARDICDGNPKWNFKVSGHLAAIAAEYDHMTQIGIAFGPITGQDAWGVSISVVMVDEQGAVPMHVDIEMVETARVVERLAELTSDVIRTGRAVMDKPGTATAIMAYDNGKLTRVR